MSSENTPTGFIDPRSGPTQMNPRSRHFLTGLTLVTGGGMFIDGYVFAVIGITLALQTFTTELSVTPLWAGLLSSSTLIGIFLGASLFGWMTGKYGRKPLFLADLLAFALAAIGLFFVQQAARVGPRAGHHLPDRPARPAGVAALAAVQGPPGRGRGGALRSGLVTGVGGLRRRDPGAGDAGCAVRPRTARADRLRLHLLALPGAPLLRDHLLPGRRAEGARRPAHRPVLADGRT